MQAIQPFLLGMQRPLDPIVHSEDFWEPGPTLNAMNNVSIQQEESLSNGCPIMEQIEVNASPVED